MTLEEKICQYARQLPDSLQEELFDFVQYLLMKVEQQERQDGSSLSLSLAMEDMENESDLYSIADIKITFT